MLNPFNLLVVWEKVFFIFHLCVFSHFEVIIQINKTKKSLFYLLDRPGYKPGLITSFYVLAQISLPASDKQAVRSPLCLANRAFCTVTDHSIYFMDCLNLTAQLLWKNNKKLKKQPSTSLWVLCTVSESSSFFLWFFSLYKSSKGLCFLWHWWIQLGHLLFCLLF